MGSEVQILPGPPSGLIEVPSGLIAMIKRSVVRLIGDDAIRWGCSSAGRAPALQAGGRRFDPDHLHQVVFPNIFTGRLPDRSDGMICCRLAFRRPRVCSLGWLSRFGRTELAVLWDCPIALGVASFGGVLFGRVIFGSVNQVLLRLWARSKGCLRVMRGPPITATV